MAPSEFNQDELNSPNWLDEDFFKNVLARNCVGKDLNVKNLSLTPGSGKGDHYASVMFRAVIEYTENDIAKTKSMIVKIMPTIEGHKKEMLESSTLFETEIEMYSEVLPKLEKLLRSVGDKTVLATNCLYHSLSPNQIIIFEDLIPLGYDVIRERPLDIIEAKFAYKKLATIHASSYYINSEKPNALNHLCHDIWTVEGFVKSSFVTDGINQFIETLETYPNLRQYKKYFIALKPTLIEKCKQTYSEYRTNKKNDGIYVLCHGDFHSKNLLLKTNKSSDKIDDIMLVDYQISFMGPMVVDLIYSFFMLIGPDIRRNHFDEIIHYYFDCFLEILQTLNFKDELPKLIDLRKQLLDHAHLELFLLVTFLPIWFGFNSKMDPEKLITSTDERKNLFYNEEFLKELEYLLPRYLNLGYLDI